MANDTLPQPPPPSTASSAAKPISLASLRQEIAAKPPMESRPPEPKTEVKAPPAQAPEPKTDAPPANPGFKDGLRKRLLEKQEPEAAPESKATKPKEEPVAKEEPAAKPDAPAKEETPVPADHLKVLPHDKPDTARRIKQLLADRDRAADEAKAAKAELEAAKKAPQTAANVEEVERLKTEYAKAQDDLLRYRRRYEIESDPEFTTKYREPIKQVEAGIETSLKKYGFGDATIEAIRKEGGFAAFSRSSKTFTVQEADPDNEGKTRPVVRTAAQLARGWLDGLPVSDSEFIKAGLGKQQLLQSEEQAAITKAQEDAKGYFENQTKAQREAAEKAAETTKAMAAEYEKWAEETETKTDFLKEVPIPDNATEDQRKEIEDRNEFAKQLRAGLRKNPSNVKEYTQLKFEAAESHHLRREMGAKERRIAELEAQLSKAKGAMKTTAKAGSILTASKDAPKDVTPADPTNFKAGLRARLQAKAGSVLDE
jgi:hypothetical protein